WLGEKVSAAELRERLRGKAAPAPAVKLADLKRQTLEVPPSTSWVSGRPASSSSVKVVAGPTLLAAFGPEGGKPIWQQTFPEAPTDNVFAPMVHGPFLPAVADGRVYSRWGVESVAKGVGLLCDVAAFDAAGGRLLWSTSALPAWKDLCAINDPAVAD